MRGGVIKTPKRCAFAKKEFHYVHMNIEEKNYSFFSRDRFLDIDDSMAEGEAPTDRRF